MKLYGLWVVFYAALVFAASAAHDHLVALAPPKQVAIVVDGSFQMKTVWSRVPSTLRRLQHQHQGSKFAVVTRRNLNPGWQDQAKMPRVRPFGPRKFDRLSKAPILEQADVTYLISNAALREIGSGWTLITPK